MKTIISIFLIILLPFFSFQTFAHDKHKHYNNTMQKENKIADTIMQVEISVENQHTQHHHEHAITDFPNYHPLIVHFPIVLLIIAALFQLLSFFVYKKELSFATLLLLAAGSISAWLASNPFHAHTTELTGNAKTILETHELFAAYTWWFALAALLTKVVSHFFLNRKIWLEIAVALLLIASAVCVSVAGHHGAQLVHIEGVGVQGKFLETEHHNH